MTQWHFYEKVYRRWLVVMIGPFDEFKDELRSIKFHDVETLQLAKGMCIELGDYNNDTGQNANIIWLPYWDTATLIHEITHLVMMFFDQVGVPVSRDNTEGFAFYTEYWYAEIQRVRKRMPNGRTPAQARKQK